MNPADDLPPIPEKEILWFVDGVDRPKVSTAIRAYALAARAERDEQLAGCAAVIENLNADCLLHHQRAEAAERDLVERTTERNQWLQKAETAEARVKELEHPAVHAPSLERVKEAHSYMPLDRWPETTKAAHRMYAQSAAPAEETCYLCALIVLLDKAEKRVAELEEKLMVMCVAQINELGLARCPDCLGSEFVGFKRGVRCPRCNGTGSIQVRPSPDPPDPAPLAAQGVEGEPHHER